MLVRLTVGECVSLKIHFISSHVFILSGTNCVRWLEWRPPGCSRKRSGSSSSPEKERRGRTGCRAADCQIVKGRWTKWHLVKCQCWAYVKGTWTIFKPMSWPVVATRYVTSNEKSDRKAHKLSLKAKWKCSHLIINIKSAFLH